MKKTLALLLALCMAFSMFSVVAFADNAATYNVALVDAKGNVVTEVKAGESVWAVISVANYENYVGDSNVDWDADDIAVASEYDKNIAVITTYLELDTTAFTVATNDGKIVWESPYKVDIADQGGDMQFNLEGNVLKTMLRTDSEGGIYYAITKSELDANNGELFRIKLDTAADAAVGNYSVALNGGDGVTVPGLATITSAAGEATITTEDVTLALGAAANVALYNDDVAVEVPDSYTIVDSMDGFNYADWTVNTTTTNIKTDEADKGSYTFHGSSSSQRADIVYNDAYYLDGVDVDFSAMWTFVQYNNNNFRQDAEYTYGGVAIGNLEFRMEDYVVPQIWYNGEMIATADAIVEVPSFDDVDEEGNPVYATWADYTNAYKEAIIGHNGMNFTYGIKVVDGVVTGYINYVNANKETVAADVITVALPAGAFAEAVKPAAITAGTFGYVDATAKGAKYVIEKAIVDIDAIPVIEKAPFTADDWTFVAGQAVVTDPESFARDKSYIAEDGSFIQTMSSTSDIIVKHAKTFTGSEFYLEYTAKRESYMGNGQEYSERMGVRVGDFYFAMNRDGQLPYVEYKGEVVYQGETAIWNLVGADAAIVEDVEGTEFKDRYYKWSYAYEGANPTYKITLKDNKLTVTFTSANYAETVIVPEMTVDFGEFVDAQISLGGNHGYKYTGHERYTSFYMDNALDMKKVDIGLLNAQVEAFVDRGDKYDNIPAYITTVATIAGSLTDGQKAVLTEENIKKANDFIILAGQVKNLGEVTLNSYLVYGLADTDWTKTSGSFKTADYGTYIQGSNATDIKVTTKNAFDLSNGFEMGVGYGKLYYNTKSGYNFTIKVGDVAVKIAANPAGITGEKIYGGSIVDVSVGDTVVATGEGTYTSTSAFKDAVGSATVTADKFAYTVLKYENGVLTVTINGNVVAQTAIDADLTNATVALVESKLTGWSSSFAYDFYLTAGEKVVDLFELNTQMGTLANVVDFTKYSPIAATADEVLPQIPAEKKAIMNNIAVYEAYREAYVFVQKGVTYNVINGFYDNEWTDVKTNGGNLVRGDKEIAYTDTNSETAYKTVSYPNTALYMENVRGHQTMTSAATLNSAGYFKIVYRASGVNYQDRYLQWKIGDLAIRATLDAPNTSPDVNTGMTNMVVFQVYYKGEVIHTITGEANDFGYAQSVAGCSPWMFVNCDFTITYDNGNLKISFYNGDTKHVTPSTGVDLTALEGWDGTYTPDGNKVELDVYTSYSQFAVTKLVISGKASIAFVDTMDAMVEADPAAAKRIYDSLSDKTIVSAAAKAILDKEFTVTADENAGYTYTIDGYTNAGDYRYGDTITLAGDCAEGYAVEGWYDAEGNLLSAEETYTVKVEPGVEIVVKAVESEECAHENTSVENATDATCGAAGYTGDTVCGDCGETIETGSEIPATGEHANTSVVGATDATCGAAGYTGDTVCGDCGKTIATGSEIPATGAHAWGEFVPNEDGLTETKTCGTCGATETQDIEVQIGGTTGDVTWRFDNGTLYIEGNGKMANYVNVGDVAPWQTVRKETTAIVIGDGVTYIGNRAFKGFNKVTTVTIGKDVTTMGYECFYACNKITSINLPEGLTHLGALTFYNCTGLTQIDIPASVTNLENRAFKGSGLTSVVVPDTVKTMGYEVFMNCANLAEVDFTKGVSMLQPRTFENCTSLTTFNYTRNMCRIRTRAFYGCTALESVVFEDANNMWASSNGNDAKIASDAFEGCNATLKLIADEGTHVEQYAAKRGFVFEAK